MWQQSTPILYVWEAATAFLHIFLSMFVKQLLLFFLPNLSSPLLSFVLPNTVMEVATGVAHPPGGLHHNNKILLDYTRVKVHTVKPEFMQWRIDYATPEGMVLLGDVMGQFILWHKQDIILTASSLPPPLSNLE